MKTKNLNNGAVVTVDYDFENSFATVTVNYQGNEYEVNMYASTDDDVTDGTENDVLFGFKYISQACDGIDWFMDGMLDSFGNKFETRMKTKEGVDRLKEYGPYEISWMLDDVCNSLDFLTEESREALEETVTFDFYL